MTRGPGLRVLLSASRAGEKNNRLGRYKIRKRKRADKKKGGRNFVFSSGLRAGACGDESTKSIVFFACAAGGQEASGAGLLSITAPRGRGGRTLPASGLHPSPRRVYLGLSASLLNGVWSNGGWNEFHLAYRFLIYRGHLHVEWLFLF